MALKTKPTTGLPSRTTSVMIATTEIDCFAEAVLAIGELVSQPDRVVVIEAESMQNEGEEHGHP